MDGVFSVDTYVQTDFIRASALCMSLYTAHGTVSLNWWAIAIHRFVAALFAIQTRDIRSSSVGVTIIVSISQLPMCDTPCNDIDAYQVQKKKQFS